MNNHNMIAVPAEHRRRVALDLIAAARGLFHLDTRGEHLSLLELSELNALLQLVRSVSVSLVADIDLGRDLESFAALGDCAETTAERYTERRQVYDERRVRGLPC